MSDLEQRIRDALSMRAEATDVAEREWEQTILEDAPDRRLRRSPSRPIGRRQVALGFAAVFAAVAVLAVGLGTTGWLGNNHRAVSTANQPAGNGDRSDCVRTTDLRRAEEADGLRLLPTWLPPGQKVTYASARVNLLEQKTCSRAPTALVLIDYVDGDRSRVERAASLTGPSASPYIPLNGHGPVDEPIEVRGALGTLTRLPVGPDVPADIKRRDGFFDTLTLHWTEPDGSSWKLQATHLSTEELVRMAEGFVLDSTAAGPPAVAPTPPEGYEVAWQLPQRPGPLPAEEPWWMASTNRGEGDAGDFSIRVSRQAVPRPPIGIAVAGVVQEVHLLQVRGHPAVFISGQLTWDETPGVQVILQGNADLATLVHIAESMAPVPPNDHRIKNP